MTEHMAPSTSPSNYDESKVPDYTLPDPLRTASGDSVETTTDWEQQLRPRLLETFTTCVYGNSPAYTGTPRIEVRGEDPRALGGLAVRKEIRLLFGHDADAALDILLYIPAHAENPVPVFAGLNFFGNHTVDPDPAITLSHRWMRTNDTIGVVNHRATEATRGSMARRWPLELILRRGYAVATAYCGDLVPDHPDGLSEGIIGFLRGHRPERAADEGGAISGWAWGLQRIMDYLEGDAAIDAARMALIGHSRLGKTALWAGALDPRAALVVSNNSGCTGAALSRRCFGETLEIINTAFPHWFCLNYRRYNAREHDLPVDQHQLLALIAPRALHVASASEDRWADPLGEFLAAKHAGPVYALFGKGGVGVDQPPAPGKTVGDALSYRIREGKHDIVSEDWTHVLDFADRQFTYNHE